MKILNLKNVSFYEQVEFPIIGKIYDIVDNFSTEFIFGKVYCINGNLSDGGWGLSWVIAGNNDEEKGTIKIDNKVYNQQQRVEIACSVGLGIKKEKSFSRDTIRGQIREGLKNNRSAHFKDDNELIELLHLSPERLDRGIESLSNERWRASIAIGLANGKKIYCFPWMKTYFIENFIDSWLFIINDIFKRYNCLVIIPTPYNKKIKKLFDEVVNLK